jgi:hypothetical protein
MWGWLSRLWGRLMATFNAMQASFAAGELSPFLYGRVDLAKFHVGARTMLNFFVHPHGGASNRPGTRFVGEVDDSTVRHRLIPFQFRTLPAGQTYALVFGHMTMQVVMFNNGAPGFVESAPGVIYTLPTPYVAADLPLLKFVQSQDTMTLTHPSYASSQLTRTGHAAWTLTPITFAPKQGAPTGITSSAPGTADIYAITALSDATGEESLQSADVGSSSATSTLTWAPLQGCTNYFVYKKAATGTVYGFIGQAQAATGATTVTFTDANIAPDVGNTPPQQRLPFGGSTITGATLTAGGSGYTAPTATVADATGSGAVLVITSAGGVITGVSVTKPGQNYSANAHAVIQDGAGTGAIITVTPTYDHTDSAGVDYYVIDTAALSIAAGGSGYHAGVHVSLTDGFVFGTVVAATVVGGVITAVSVPSPLPAFPLDGRGAIATVTDSAGTGAVINLHLTNGTTTNPQCTAYYLQRQAFAGTLAQPQTLWFSDVGAFNNMAVSQPTKDSDAITRTLVGQQVNEIRHLVPAGTNLMLMTSGAEWRCWPGPSASALTPAACFTLPQTAHGSSHVPPIWTQNSLLFVKEKGSRVIELRYDAIQDLYQSFDMSVLSQHLLYDTTAQYQIQEWALASEPFQIAWGVRNDGVLLGFTFMREHEVYAWHRHVTDGVVESVCSITESDGSGGYYDAVYLIVNRTIGGQTKRYVERMAPRIFATIADAWFVDCALQYSGAPTTTVTGLDHLEGKTVAMLGDGSVVPSQVVTNGAVHLDGPYSKVTVGLSPGNADLVLLNLDVPSQAGSVQGQMKKISQVTIRVKDARGIQIGIEQEMPSGSSTGKPALREIKQRRMETLGSPIQPFSGDFQVNIPTEWQRGGRIFIRQSYPLPCTILAVIPEVVTGD